ncbi:MAG: hypothetical protein KatS3mg088_131 [Patescibacteria group bacterium]|nr:MAG: hypothetical protein KatS3mg088_131 [Patescibacteria group bacterium]
MKLRNKKIITLFTFFILIIVLTTYFLPSLLKNKRNVTITPEPRLNQNYKGNYNITLSVNKESLNLPKELPLIEIESTNPLDENYAINIANKLGFANRPQKIDDVFDGITFFWKNDNSTLFIYSKTRKIKYNQNSFLNNINKQLSDEEILNIAKEFVIQNKILDKDSFQADTLIPIKSDSTTEGFKETTKKEADLYQVNIKSKAIGYSIVNPNSVEPDSYIRIKKDGTIYSFQITVNPSFKESITKYKVKNYEEIEKSLNQAVLIEIRNNNYLLLSELPTDFIKEIKVDKIEIAYLSESTKETILYPIFKMSGKAILKNSQEETLATLYISAISNNP